MLKIKRKRKEMQLREERESKRKEWLKKLRSLLDRKKRKRRESSLKQPEKLVKMLNLRLLQVQCLINQHQRNLKLQLKIKDQLNLLMHNQTS